MTGFSWLSENALYVKELLNTLFSGKLKLVAPQTRVSIESLGLTQDQLNAVKRSIFLKLWFFAAFSTGVFIYGFYSLPTGHWERTLISLSLGLVSLAQVFRQHFWLFQIQQGNLGYRWQEWFRHTFDGRKK